MCIAFNHELQIKKGKTNLTSHESYFGIIITQLDLDQIRIFHRMRNNGENRIMVRRWRKFQFFLPLSEQNQEASLVILNLYSSGIWRGL